MNRKRRLRICSQENTFLGKKRADRSKVSSAHNMDWGGFLWVLEGREQGEELPLVCICCSSSCSDSRAALILRWIVGQELQLCFGMLVFSPVLLTSGRQEKRGGCRAARNNYRNICQLIHHTLQHHLPFTFPMLKSHCTIQIPNCSWMQQKMRGCGVKKRDPSIIGQCF